MTSDELCRPMPEDTSEYLGDQLEKNWNRELERAKAANRQPRLLYAVVRTFYREYGIKYGMLHAINELVFRLVFKITKKLL